MTALLAGVVLFAALATVLVFACFAIAGDDD